MIDLKILVVGGGAREHAICHAVCNSNYDIELYSVMHNLNPGIISISKNYKLIKETSLSEIVKHSTRNKIDLVIVGPEAPLEKGLVNELNKNGIIASSPTKEAAMIETDKEWMRNLLRKYDIHGQLKCECFTDVNRAKRFIESLNNQVAIKPIGLTGGKGVKIYGDHFNGLDECIKYVNEVISNRIGGKAKVLIEEKVEGEEFTLQALSDGYSILPFHAVQDNKRLLPGDKGPNTGGMGSFSCSDGLLPFLSKSDYEEAAAILQSIVEALNKEDCRYIGPIYGQFMITATGIKIIEINARFGDPEAMNVLPLLKTDFVDLCNAMIDGNISTKKIKLEKKSTVCKYVVPEGYGFESIVGSKVFVDENSISNIGSKLFYASVNIENDSIYTTSSRSLAVVGIEDKVYDAERKCEEALFHIKGDHIFIRHDIGTTNLIQKRIDHMNKLRGM